MLIFQFLAKQVVEDFASENVVYLELRTTPKVQILIFFFSFPCLFHCRRNFDGLHPFQKNDSIGMTKRSYMEAVVEGLKAVNAVDINFMPHDADAGDFMDSQHIKSGTCNGATRKKIYVRLLLSIDRRETTEAAMETVCGKLCASRKYISLCIF